MNLVLIGYRGTGKTTVARLLAARMGWPCLDADDLIETRAGRTIAELFAEGGEAAFREFENQVVADLAARENCVIALGGGSVMRPENRAVIERLGKVILLSGDAETLWQRIQADRATTVRRPNLTAQGGITEIIATLAERSAVYRQCAHLEVDTTGKSPAEVADAILAQVNL